VITPYGKTDPIPIKRGTLQGDGLSPFLFILYLEPLLRWLNVGARGYHPGSLKHMDPITHVSNTAYADDLSLYTGGHSDMINQTDKVSTSCTWAGLTISQPKTLATAALYHRAPAHPFDHQLTGRLLANIRIGKTRSRLTTPNNPTNSWGVVYHGPQLEKATTRYRTEPPDHGGPPGQMLPLPSPKAKDHANLPQSQSQVRLSPHVLLSPRH
jgi:hypothetical protein